MRFLSYIRFMWKNKLKISVLDIAVIGVMVAVIEVCKAALSFLPNIELTSFWIIMFTLFFRWRVLLVIPVFILIEGSIYGVNIWWIMYLYIWPLLSLISYLCRKKDSVLFWSILSGFFGLAFGFLCSFPYVAIGISNGGIRSGLYAGFTWWIAGIPWDIVHCVGNFSLMLVLYRPISVVMNRMKKQGILPD